MKNKIMKILLCAIILLGITGCGSSEEKNSAVLENDHIKIDGIYVDESFEDENLSLVYLFYTINAKDENLDLASSSTSIKVNGVNDYSPVVEKNYIPYFTNYYYSSLIKKIYVGKSYKMCSTFKVAKGDLVDSKEITLVNYKLSDISDIKFTTDEVKKMDNLNSIAKDLDKATYDTMYNKEQEKLAKADSSTVNKVRKDLNGYYFEFYVNVGKSLSKYKIEFEKTNKFKVSNSLGMSNSGTYDVRKGAIVLNYKTGGSLNLYYEYDKGDITLTNTNDAFGTLIDYDPLDEE